MKKDILFVLCQFILFALYFIDWDLTQYELPEWADTIMAVVVSLGFVIIIFGILNLKNSVSPFPSPRRNSSFISKGIYRYVRHPIYTGIIIAMIGYSICLVAPLKLLITAILVIVLYFKSNYEEKLLVENFNEYDEYRKKTGRFLPRWTDKRS